MKYKERIDYQLLLDQTSNEFLCILYNVLVESNNQHMVRDKLNEIICRYNKNHKVIELLNRIDLESNEIDYKILFTECDMRCILDLYKQLITNKYICQLLQDNKVDVNYIIRIIHRMIYLDR